MDVMRHHGPMFVIGSVLIVAGIQLLAIGLLGELQVRLFYAGRQRTPYSIESMCACMYRKSRTFCQKKWIRE